MASTAGRRARRPGRGHPPSLLNSGGPGPHGPHLLYPQSPPTGPCVGGRNEPLTTPHMSSALESSFLAVSVLVVGAEIWQEGTVALSTSPEVPRGGHRPGDVVRPGHGFQSNLERLQLTSLPRVHHASLVLPPFTLGAIFFPKLSPVLKALGLVKVPSTCPRAAGHVETRGNRKPSCQGTRKTSWRRRASC